MKLHCTLIYALYMTLLVSAPTIGMTPKEPAHIKDCENRGDKNADSLRKAAMKHLYPDAKLDESDEEECCAGRDISCGLSECSIL